MSYSSKHSFFKNKWQENRKQWKKDLFTKEAWKVVKKEVCKANPSGNRRISKEAEVIYELYFLKRKKGPIRVFINEKFREQLPPRKQRDPIKRNDLRLFWKDTFMIKKSIPNNQLAYASLNKYILILVELTCEHKGTNIITSDFLKSLFRDEMVRAGLNPDRISSFHIRNILYALNTKGETNSFKFDIMDNLDDKLTLMVNKRKLIWKQISQEAKDQLREELRLDWNKTFAIQIPATENILEQISKCFRDENERLHNSDGPAVIHPNGRREWYWHGELIMSSV